MSEGKQKRAHWDARKIRALRRHLGLTQEELASEMGARQQTFSEWETGQYEPRGPSSTLLNIIAERADFRYGEDESRETDKGREEGR